MLLLKLYVFLLDGFDCEGETMLLCLIMLESMKGLCVLRVLLLAGGENVIDLLVYPVESDCSFLTFLPLFRGQKVLFVHFNIKYYSYKSTA